jgi:hypothetical protein
MSFAEIERFAADMQSNEALRAEAKKVQAERPHATPMDRAVAFAATKGYAFTADEIKEYARSSAKAAGKPLTDAELDGIAAGILPVMVGVGVVGVGAAVAGLIALFAF